MMVLMGGVVLWYFLRVCVSVIFFTSRHARGEQPHGVRICVSVSCDRVREFRVGMPPRARSRKKCVGPRAGREFVFRPRNGERARRARAPLTLERMPRARLYTLHTFARFGWVL